MPSKVPPTVGWENGFGVRTSFEVRSVYELLDVIRKKPGLFIGEPSVTGIWHFLSGFQFGLHSVGQPFETDDPPFIEFHGWIAARLGFSTSTSGWRDMLLQSLGDETAAFERFFLELDVFRRGRDAS